MAPGRLPAPRTDPGGVNRISMCWLMGTLKCLPSPEHVQAYFDEWVFPFRQAARR
jgi:hypothetical protein